MATANGIGSPEKIFSYPKHKIRILLLENVHPQAVQKFKDQGFAVESLKESLGEAELAERIKGVHVLGIRSKTKVTAAVLENAKSLKAIGCFCIGTDQVDLHAAEVHGIPVFNSPFANTRSVAELIMAEIICLSRRLGDTNTNMHKGIWQKSAKNCNEVRGKTVGIVGYGHVGSQVAVLAEGMGMSVIYYDILRKLPLGNSRPCESLEDVLRNADYVTLHVPKTPQTELMIKEREIMMMKKGSYLLNAARGTVVDIEALASALRSGHLNGAAVDVYPSEPASDGNGFVTPLQGCPNTILTPHVGGSTEEAQANIGDEVGSTLIKFINRGTTDGAVNFPNLDMNPYPNTHRILNVHKNRPGVLKDINSIIAQVNVSGQTLGTTREVGYIMIDVDSEVSTEVKEAIRRLPHSISTRILY